MDVTTQDIKLAILKAIKDKYDGEYRYNILRSVELGRGAVENYLRITFDEFTGSGGELS